MDSSYFSPFSTKALTSFHSHERRQLFTRLIFDIDTNPNLAMEIIAFWMWLEEVGHPLIILPLLELQDTVLRLVAVEAKKCLTSLPNPPKFAARDSPVNLHFVNRHREVALWGVTTILNNVCTTIFSDIIKLLAETKSNGRSQFRVRGEGSSRMGEMGINCTSAHLLHPTLPHALLGREEDHATSNQPRQEEEGEQKEEEEGLHLSYMQRTIQQLRCLQMDKSTKTPHINSPHLPCYPNRDAQDCSMMAAAVMAQAIYQNLVNEIRHSNMVINTNNRLMQSWCPPQRDVPRDERTLFVTFSNGYPLDEGDLRDFFTRNFGPIETIYIQQVPPGGEPLFARIVFNLQETILLILDRNERVKFRIKGKHVWARRYVPKKKVFSEESQ